jgi:sialic acid synthase SpsE
LGHEDYVAFNNAMKNRMDWFATAQDKSSLNFLMEFDLPIYKIASTNAHNLEFVKWFNNRIPNDKILDISVAGLDLLQIWRILEATKNKKQVILNHCVAEYPCPVSELRLGNITRMIKEFQDDRISIGYSGHEIGIAPSIAAIDLGAKYIERHFATSKTSFVHHIDAALEPDEFKTMVAVGKGVMNLSKYYAGLDEEAFDERFGMTEIEKQFLIEKRYGIKNIKQGV